MGEILVLLPRDIVEEIFLRLPVKSLIRFRCLSKQCQAFIFEPGFARLHYQRACEDIHSTKFFVSNGNKLLCIDGEAIFNNGIIDDDFKFIKTISSCRLNSCEGLVIVYVLDTIYREPHIAMGKYHIELWNPLTGYYKRLPDFKKKIRTLSFGFGYDYSRDDYKIVSPFYDEENQKMLFAMFSLRANSWRTIHLGFTLNDMRIPAIPGKFLNGAIHWLVWAKTLFPQLIASFDVASEKIHPLQAPPHDPNNVLDFGILKECLCVCIGDREWNVDVWIMKEYREVGSWTKVAYLHCSSVLADFPSLKPLYLLEKGEALMLNYKGILSIYNFRKSKGRRLFNSKECYKLATRHVESLFPFMFFNGLDCVKSHEEKRKVRKNKQSSRA